ncbi:MAG: NADH-quinone oxidoreductase subunit J [Verrucomicrobiota bacterium]|nr:NADH-quinone oxidoreductase subunit J [Verrucomicrobiota bacterium]
MIDFMFYFLAALTVLSALMVPCSRNPVNGAMFMIVSFVGTAALFALLQAFFLAIVQVLVYAGAVMVLFLFIIMLLNIEKTQALKVNRGIAALSIVAFLAMVAAVWFLFVEGRAGPFPALPAGAVPASLTKHFGYELFTKYMLPFQVTGFLLLIAMIGVIYISKKPADETVDATADAKGANR